MSVQANVSSPERLRDEGILAKLRFLWSLKREGIFQISILITDHLALNSEVGSLI